MRTVKKRNRNNCFSNIITVCNKPWSRLGGYKNKFLLLYFAISDFLFYKWIIQTSFIKLYLNKNVSKLCFFNVQTPSSKPGYKVSDQTYVPSTSFRWYLSSTVLTFLSEAAFSAPGEDTPASFEDLPEAGLFLPNSGMTCVKSRIQLDLEVIGGRWKHTTGMIIQSLSWYK